jgi:hypothetical protein
MPVSDSLRLVPNGLPAVGVAFVTEWRSSLPVVDCRAEVRFEVWWGRGDVDVFRVCEEMLIADDAISILTRGGDVPKSGKVESSRSDSRRAEST